MRVVAFLVSLVVMAGACFPHNARHRTIAKAVEGGVLVGGIAMLAIVNTGADCQTEVPGEIDQDCETKATILGNIGLGLILAGLVGFIATVSTSPDDKPDAPASDGPKREKVITPPPPTTPIAVPPTDPTPPTEPTPPAEPTPPTEPTAPTP